MGRNLVGAQTDDLHTFPLQTLEVTFCQVGLSGISLLFIYYYGYGFFYTVTTLFQSTLSRSLPGSVLLCKLFDFPVFVIEN